MRGVVVALILLVASSTGQVRRKCREDVLLLEDLIYDLARARENCKVDLVELQDILLLENDERETCILKLSECEEQREHCWNESALASPIIEVEENIDGENAIVCSTLREKLALSCQPQHDIPSSLERNHLATLIKIGCVISPNAILPNVCNAPIKSTTLLRPLRPSSLGLLVEAVQAHYWAAQRTSKRLLECDTERHGLVNNAPSPVANVVCDGISWRQALAGSIVCASIAGVAVRCITNHAISKGSGKKEKRKANPSEGEIKVLKQQLTATITQCEQKASEIAGLQKKHSTLQQEAKALQRRAASQEKTAAALEQLQRECRRLQAVQDENAALRQRAALYEKTANALKEVQQECLELKVVWEENASLRKRLAELQFSPCASSPHATEGNGTTEDVDFEEAVRLLASLTEERLVSELEHANARAACTAPDVVGDKDIAFLSELMGGSPGRRVSVDSDKPRMSTASSECQSPPASSPGAGELSDGDDNGNTSEHHVEANGTLLEGSSSMLQESFSAVAGELQDALVEEGGTGGCQEDDSGSNAGSEGSASAERLVVTPACSRHWCNVSALGVAFRLPVIGCRWRSMPPVQGQILCIRRFVPEDRRLAEKLVLFMVAETVPWDMSLETYHELCRLHIQTMLHDSIQYLEDGPRIVADTECQVVQFLQQAPVPLFSFTAMVLRPSCTAVSWQIVQGARTEEAATAGRHTVLQLAEQLLSSVVLYPPASQVRNVSEE